MYNERLPVNWPWLKLIWSVPRNVPSRVKSTLKKIKTSYDFRSKFVMLEICLIRKKKGEAKTMRDSCKFVFLQRLTGPFSAT